jgi:phage terminase small subunit
MGISMSKALTDESKPLTAKMLRFVEAYLANDGNGTRAAITAGYGQKSAHVTASRLLKLPKVQDALRYGVDAIMQRGMVKAANRMVKLVDNRSAYIAYEASKDVLDRTGVGVGDGKGSGRGGLQVNITINDPRGPQGTLIDVTPGGQKRDSVP